LSAVAVNDQLKGRKTAYRKLQLQIHNQHQRQHQYLIFL